MAWSKQAKKRMRQNEKRRVFNKGVRSSMKTALKKAQSSIQDPNISVNDSVKVISEAVSQMDKASKRNIIHKNKASRLKSRLAKALNRANKSQQPSAQN